MQTTLIISAIVIVSFFLGFQFAKSYYYVNKTLGCLKIFISLAKGEITNEEAKKQINELIPDDL